MCQKIFLKSIRSKADYSARWPVQRIDEDRRHEIFGIFNG